MPEVAGQNTEVTNDYPPCPNNNNNSYMYKAAMLISFAILLSLCVVYLIINSMRRYYQPIRPKIKKTYVVHKNVTPTPLTCRPTTQQCEITIEDCCNMNICDTVS